MLWQREHKRACLFEDGEVRVFGEPYYRLLQPDTDADPGLRLLLRSQAESRGLLDDAGGGRVKIKAAVPRTSDHVALFRELFPAGFHGDAWQHAHRSRPGGRRVKALRDPAIAEAKQLLARAELENLIQAGEPETVRLRMLCVLDGCNLVPRAQIVQHQGVAFDDKLAAAWLGQIHGLRLGPHDPLATLQLETRAKGLKPLNWQMATALRALVYPDDHLWVRPALLRKAHASAGMETKIPTQPTHALYQRLTGVAMDLRFELSRAELRPRDLFDLVDFLQVTHAPKHKERLYELMSKRIGGKNGAPS